MKNKSWALFKLAGGGWSEEIGERMLGDRHSLSRHCPQHMRDTVSGRSRKGRGQKQLMMGPVWEDLQKQCRIDVMQYNFQLRHWLCGRAHNEDSSAVVCRLNWGNIRGSDVIREAVSLISKWDKDIQWQTPFTGRISGSSELLDLRYKGESWDQKSLQAFGQCWPNTDRKVTVHPDRLVEAQIGEWEVIPEDVKMDDLCGEGDVKRAETLSNLQSHF